jgi:hypothetical protein
LSPGFISSVLAFGVNVARSDNRGPGGPVGTPLAWINPKLTGSMQLGLQLAKFSVHFEAVDGERGAPVRVVAADAVLERCLAGRIEPQLHERRAPPAFA